MSSFRAPKPKSLLDEVKDSVNWSSRVNPSTLARPSSARDKQNVICFSLREAFEFSHTDVVQLLQSQLECQVEFIFIEKNYTKNRFHYGNKCIHIHVSTTGMLFVLFVCLLTFIIKVVECSLIFPHFHVLYFFKLRLR